MLGATLAAPVAPAAAPAPRTDVSFLFELTTKTPGAPAGAHVRMVYRGRDGAQPQAARRVEITYPKKSRFDHTQLPMCRATNAELQAEGRDACPKNTQIGIGETELVTRYSTEPVILDVSVFNAPKTLILLFTYPGTNEVAAVRREFDRGRSHWTDNPPTCVPPGTPPACSPLGEVTVKRFEVWDPPPGYKVTRSTLILPPKCPKSGTWFFRARFTFGDGSRLVRKSRAPCRPPKTSR